MQVGIHNGPGWPLAAVKTIRCTLDKIGKGQGAFNSLLRNESQPLTSGNSP